MVSDLVKNCKGFSGLSACMEDSEDLSVDASSQMIRILLRSASRLALGLVGVTLNS